MWFSGYAGLVDTICWLIYEQALSKVYVNLVDLLDSRVKGTTVKKFPNVKALREYTFKTKKFFNRNVAKQDKLLTVLLRHLT